MAVDAMAATPMSADPAAADAVAKPMWQQAKDQVASLQRIDPDFSDVAFLEQATQTYQKALTAENDMNSAELGSACTQNFADSLDQCVSQWKSAGIISKVTDVKLDPPTLFKLTVDGTMQQIMVRFTGQAARYKADATTGLVSEGSNQPAYFAEFATFVRPAGTTTPKSTAAGAPAHCPGCGAPVEPGTAVCGRPGVRRLLCRPRSPARALPGRSTGSARHPIPNTQPQRRPRQRMLEALLAARRVRCR